MTASALALADLDAADPNRPRKVGENRSLCPFCGDGKPRDASHRNLTYNSQTGAWNCKRCHSSGLLLDFREERPLPPYQRDRGRRRLRPRFSEPPPREEPQPDYARLRTFLRTIRPLAGTPGAEYLEGRGIPVELAIAARVFFSPSWFGHPATAFPIYDRGGRLVGANGRYTDGKDDPKAQDAPGTKRIGVFSTPGAFESSTVALVEGPIDALSLHVCGLPALAMFGTALPDWIPRACAFRRVLIATDADAAGDDAEGRWVPALEALGARCERIRPAGEGDWNDLLQRDPDGLRAAIARLMRPIVPETATAAAARPIVPETPTEQVVEAGWGTFRESLLGRARLRGYPGIEVSEWTVAGEEQWSRFTTRAAVEYLRLAADALDGAVMLEAAA